MNLKQYLIYYRDLRDLYRARQTTYAGKISYTNWWAEDPETAWFTRLIRNICPDDDVPVRFYSMFGPRKKTDESFDGIKIFYSGENMEDRTYIPSLYEREEKVKGWEHRRKTYSDYCRGTMDLSIGFGHHDDWDNYMRFPLWIMRYFEPEWGIEEIRNRIRQMEEQPVSAERRGAAVIASHDFMGTRAGICDQISDIVDISYAGKWRNSTDQLWTEYGNDKEAFLGQFRFSICPENTDAPGYCTEKVFDAIASGTIPIYHGDRNQPEPEILNYDGIILWDYEDPDSIRRNRSQIRELKEDNSAYSDFMKQHRFNVQAAEIIYDRMNALKERMKDVIQRHV